MNLPLQVERQGTGHVQYGKCFASQHMEALLWVRDTHGYLWSRDCRYNSCSSSIFHVLVC